MREPLCRIGILSDSHVGIRHDGGWNQPVWLGGEEQLFSRLDHWRSENQVDFFIHCGDIAEPGAIDRGLELLGQLGCPVAAVRGNHDIMLPVHYNDWRDGLDAAGNVQFGDSVFENDACDVFLLNNQWFDAQGQPRWHWEISPVGWVSDQQLNWLDHALSLRDDRPAIVVLHYPLDMLPPYPIPAEFAKHNSDYSTRLNALFDQHERVKVVTSGHFHCTTSCRRVTPARLHLTTAAFSEAPFQVRLLEISHQRIEVCTKQLYLPGDPVAPDPAKYHLNGAASAEAIDL